MQLCKLKLKSEMFELSEKWKKVDKQIYGRVVVQNLTLIVDKQLYGRVVVQNLTLIVDKQIYGRVVVQNLTLIVDKQTMVVLLFET